MKKIVTIGLSLVLASCLMTACGRRTVNETSVPSTNTTGTTVPATTGRHNQPTNGGGVVEDIIEDVTGGMTGSNGATNSGSSRHNTPRGR